MPGFGESRTHWLQRIVWRWEGRALCRLLLSGNDSVLLVDVTCICLHSECGATALQGLSDSQYNACSKLRGRECLKFTSACIQLSSTCHGHFCALLVHRYEMFTSFLGKGDKETFGYALLAAGEPMHIIATPPGSLGTIGVIHIHLPFRFGRCQLAGWPVAQGGCFSMCNSVGVVIRPTTVSLQVQSQEPLLLVTHGHFLSKPCLCLH
eukprot:GHRR01023363.1.p1 GENE.GHRR01023363.1~~GHRR01023363.1.p1  ORF type:complete len:208 (+),score=33.28 GHRR01023363.1:210-833(+)